MELCAPKQRLRDRSRPEPRIGRETRALSTSSNQTELSPLWKQEVNRRIAAHKSRNGSLAGQPDVAAGGQGGAGSRNAEVAARVAARYANAPSYTEALAAEARAAVRAAEAASRAAIEAQTAAEQVLAGLEAASDAGADKGAEVADRPAGELRLGWVLDPEFPSAVEPIAETRHPVHFRPRDEAMRPLVPAPPRDEGAAALPDWGVRRGESDQAAETPPPAHANLIEFPRELVATRKMRPRLAEGPYGAAAEPGVQLSIFEVDPGTISTGPETAEAATPEVAAWPGPEWSNIELDAEPAAQPVKEAAAEAPKAPAVPAPQSVPFGWRLLAATVDGALILGVFLATAAGALYAAKDLPGMREIELGSAVALAAIGAFYLVAFLALGEATPGMRYAHISLLTLEGRRPMRARRCGRLGALALSLAPVGLGLAWALFDEDHLSWHDRLSGTYLRKW